AFASGYAENNAFTDSRESAIIVKTPRIVPKGMKRHSTHAITRVKVEHLQWERHRPAIKMQIAIAIPSKNKNEPSPTKIQPRNSGGNSSPGFGVSCRAMDMKIAPIMVYSSGNKENRAARPLTM